jgi:hypothetical protein
MAATSSNCKTGCGYWPVPQLNGQERRFHVEACQRLLSKMADLSGFDANLSAPIQFSDAISI